jgi:anthraniloyl-CoA monooxygenase
VSDEAALPPSDLVVGADGANSVIRRAHAAVFLPSVDRRRNRYIWLGTRRIFQALTLTFRESAHGAFVAHSYKFGPDASTFIVEAVGEAWTRAGFEGMTAEATCAYLEQVFADDLEGHPLLTNDYVRWQTFSIVSNGGWSVRERGPGSANATSHDPLLGWARVPRAALEDAIATQRGEWAREPEVDGGPRRLHLPAARARGGSGCKPPAQVEPALLRGGREPPPHSTRWTVAYGP